MERTGYGLTPDLSVLICGLHERDWPRRRLVHKLNRQAREASDLGVCEILELVDNRGESIVSDKRNQMLDMARGAYVAFVDDDDDVADTYIEDILKAIESQPDCVGIEGMLRYGDGTEAKFLHSIGFAGWYQDADQYYRTPNHLNPIRRDIALQVGFRPHCAFGEDKDYSDRAKHYLKREVYIGHPIYFYNCLNLIPYRG